MKSFPDRVGHALIRDRVTTLLLTVGALVLYSYTLVPSVLDGDPGQFQYIGSVLGIPYPPGFPLYVLLGYVSSLLPLETIAYRLNLLSALFGACSVGALFVFLRLQKLEVFAAVAGAVTLAVLPPFWQYSTFAAEYTLNTFLVILLMCALDRWGSASNIRWAWSAFFLLGLGLTNHPTFLLFVPATLVYVVRVAKSDFWKPRNLVTSLAVAALPCLLYLYFPLRATQLLGNDYVVPGWDRSLALGIVSPFYEPSFGGLLDYLTASTFVGTLTRAWKWETLLVDWATTFLQVLSLPIILFVMIGLVRILRRRLNYAMWLVLTLLTFALVTLQYVYAAIGDLADFAPYFTKFFLPGFIILIILAAWGVDAALDAMKVQLGRIRIPARVGTVLSLCVIGGVLFFSWNELRARYSTQWIERSLEIQSKLNFMQAYPPQPDAAVVGHWGDLTPIWYEQNAENWQPQLVALYPPDDKKAQQWLNLGKPLYLVGPLLGWAPRIAERNRLTPWGPWVLVSPPSRPGAEPRLANQVSFTFRDENPVVRLEGYDILGSTFKPGDSVDIGLYWSSLADLHIEDCLVYFSLTPSDTETKSQGDLLAVNWLPGANLVAGQKSLAMYRYKIPANLPSGKYQVNAFLYSLESEKNLDILELEGKPTTLQIGTVLVE